MGNRPFLIDSFALGAATQQRGYYARRARPDTNVILAPPPSQIRPTETSTPPPGPGAPRRRPPRHLASSYAAGDDDGLERFRPRHALAEEARAEGLQSDLAGHRLHAQLDLAVARAWPAVARAEKSLLAVAAKEFGHLGLKDGLQESPGPDAGYLVHRLAKRRCSPFALDRAWIRTDLVDDIRCVTDVGHHLGLARSRRNLRLSPFPPVDGRHPDGPSSIISTTSPAPTHDVFARNNCTRHWTFGACNQLVSCIVVWSGSALGGNGSR